MASITEQLEKIQCGCERADYLRSAGLDHDALCQELDSLGFGRNDSITVPTDWRDYYSDDELREFILEYANQFTPAA